MHSGLLLFGLYWEGHLLSILSVNGVLLEGELYCLFPAI